MRDGDDRGGLSKIISIRDIDPCGVAVERCDIHNCYYLYRLAGKDTNTM